MKKLHILMLSMLFSTSMFMLALDQDDSSNDAQSNMASAPQSGQLKARLATAKQKFAAAKQKMQNMTQDQKDALKAKRQDRGASKQSRRAKLAALKQQGGPSDDEKATFKAEIAAIKQQGGAGASSQSASDDDASN
jgi:Skp family chaperone for outer membrane proteins